MSNLNTKSLLSSKARIQAPWVKVTIGNFTFGVFDRKSLADKSSDGFYLSSTYSVQYPNYIQSLQISKVNGQINQYTLQINYPVRSTDDPNFFEKVFSSVSNTRKIIFSYGDSSMPSYVYKDEEALITQVSQQFNLTNSSISYTVKAVSSSALSKSGSYTFNNTTKKKPSDEIKRLFNDSRFGLQDLFKGMNKNNLSYFIRGDDQEVELATKVNISVLDYILYLTSCMIPVGATTNNISKDIYIMTIHDDTTYDNLYSDRETLNGKEITGAYFKIEKASQLQERSDAYEIDIGYNTSTIVTSFNIDKQENYSIFYDYQNKLNPEHYIERINDKGEWEKVFAPVITSGNDVHVTRANDITWWTKLTQYPIGATITIQGLLRPAQLMTHVRLNVIFPGGNKHIASGLYIVTSQTDIINGNGYTTTLGLTRIGGD